VTRNAEEVRADRLRNTNGFNLRKDEGGGLEPLGWDDLDVITDLYDSGIAHADRLLGTLLDRLSRPDLADNTLIILTSDHGEALGEHKLAGHGALYDHDLLVPLVVALPGGDRGGSRVAPQVRLVDIVPTVLEVAGLPEPPGIDGQSLLPLIHRKDGAPRPAESYTALSNHGLALRNGQGDKYIFRNIPWPIPAGWEELYDLHSDPGETNNLAETSDRVDGFRSAAVEALAARQPGLRLEMANRSDRDCRLEFRGSGITIGSNTIKAIRPGGGCRVSEAGAFVCKLEPGDEMTLIGERVQSPLVGIDGAVSYDGAPDESAFSLELEIGVDDSDEVVLDPPDESTGGVAVSIRWVGDPGILGLDPSETDDELRQQLEALGYIQ
jgi:hypothetical protein